MEEWTDKSGSAADRPGRCRVVKHSTNSSIAAVRDDVASALVNVKLKSLDR